MTGFTPDTGLVVVDMQNDFADRRGSLHVPGGDGILAEVNRAIEDAVAAGAPVAYTQDWHPPDTPHFAKDGGTWPVHCVAGTWGAELVPGLLVEGPVVRKGSGGEDGYSGFTVRDPAGGTRSPTGLADLLSARGARQLVVLGLATDYCVKETVLDALRLGFPVAVRAQAVRAVDVEPGDGQRALEAMVQAGAQVTGWPAG